jgi:hypothetical protein
MVEGARLRTGCEDEAQHGVHVAKHVACGNSNHPESFAPKQCISCSIPPGLVAIAVHFSIDLDGEPAFETRKIDRDPPQRKLPPEFQSVTAFPQMPPKQYFRQAHFSPQLACALYLPDGGAEDAWAPSTAQLR